MGSEAGASVDVVDTPDEFTVFVDLPGCREEDITIQVEDDMLLITAERIVEYEEGSSLYQQERPTRIRRSVRLPAKADVEGADAEYEDGVAKIILPKSEGDQRKTIGFH